MEHSELCTLYVEITAGHLPFYDQSQHLATKFQRLKGLLRLQPSGVFECLMQLLG